MDGHEQCIQPLEARKGKRHQYAENVHPEGRRATRTPLSDGISIPHVEVATSPTILALSSTAARRVSGHSAPLLP